MFRFGGFSGHRHLWPFLTAVKTPRTHLWTHLEEADKLLHLYILLSVYSKLGSDSLSCLCFALFPSSTTQMLSRNLGIIPRLPSPGSHTQPDPVYCRLCVSFTPFHPILRGGPPSTLTCSVCSFSSAALPTVAFT